MTLLINLLLVYWLEYKFRLHLLKELHIKQRQMFFLKTHAYNEYKPILTLIGYFGKVSLGFYDNSQKKIF
jgi:hypothetical protein